MQCLYIEIDWIWGWRARLNCCCVWVYRVCISCVTLAPLFNSIILYTLYLGTRWWFWWRLCPLLSLLSICLTRFFIFFPNKRSIFNPCLTGYNHFKMCEMQDNHNLVHPLQKPYLVLLALTGIIRCPLRAQSVWEKWMSCEWHQIMDS